MIDLLTKLIYTFLLSEGMFLGMIRISEDYFRFRLKVLILDTVNKANKDDLKRVKDEEDNDNE